MSRAIHKNDFVRRSAVPHFLRQANDKAKGQVVEEIGRNYCVVKWPDGAHTKHHQDELIRCG